VGDRSPSPASGEIADAIIFLASDEPSFVARSELVLDSGYTAA
jgi:NAD(P)-dependent dehydrogenase (short-subunit alcohol dehydrogenase family)